MGDKKNQRALHLALPTRQNQKERHTRAGGIWGDSSTELAYKEDTISRDADRRAITSILVPENAGHQSPVPSSDGSWNSDHVIIERIWSIRTRYIPNTISPH